MFVVKSDSSQRSFKTATEVADHLRRDHGLSTGTTVRLHNQLISMSTGLIAVTGRRATIEESNT